MKIVRGLVLSTLVSAALMTRVSADPVGTEDNPGVPMDQDGTPLSVTNPQARQPTPEEIEAYQQMQAKAEKDKDWLLRGYEQVRQLRLNASASDKRADLFYQISSNKDLAGLAGLPVIEQPTAPSGSNATAPNKSGVTSPVVPGSGNGLPAHRDLSKPLITPLGGAAAAGLHNFYSTLQPTASPSMLPGSSSPRSSPAPEPQEDTDSLAIETPGMIAAEKDPLLDKASANLSLDLLARDPVEQASTPEDNSPTKLELPLPTNAARLQKAQEAALSVPGLVKSTIPVAPVLPIPEADEPTPIGKIPQANPVRSRIADPHDIFYR